MSPLKSDAVEHHGPGVRVRPATGAPQPAPVPVPPAPARPSSGVRLSGALLPPRPEQAAHAPAPAAGATPATTPATPSSAAPVAEDLLGDEPILVVESIPDGTLFDRTPLPLHARTVSLRYDTAAVGGFVGAILMGVAFMLGRTGATSADGPPQPMEIAKATAPANPGPAAPVEEAPRIALRQDVPFNEPTPAPPVAPVVEEEAPRSAAPAPSPAPAPAVEARYAIMVIGGIPLRNATEVAKFLEEKGFKANTIGSGDNHGVLVGAYADKKGEPFEADLDKIRKLAYKDGKKAFAGAYGYPLRRGRG